MQPEGLLRDQGHNCQNPSPSELHKICLQLPKQSSPSHAQNKRKLFAPANLSLIHTHTGGIMALPSKAHSNEKIVEIGNVPMKFQNTNSQFTVTPGEHSLNCQTKCFQLYKEL
jgi:hypothetical protein